MHRTTLAPGDTVVVDDLPISSPLRTAWLAALAEQGTGRFGVARLRKVMSLLDPRAESAPESRVRVALVLAGLSPVPQHEIRVDGRFLARVDFAWPEEKVVVEYEGAYHFDGVQIARDDARIAQLEAAGWLVIRISAADLRDLDAVVGRVAVALAARRP